MNQIKKGGILSYINLAITNVVGIMMTPFIIRTLGDDEYGLFALIGAFVGYLSVLDLGLNNAIVRYAAQYRNEGKSKEQENFLALSFMFYAIIALVIACIGGVMYWNVDNLFGNSLTLEQMGKAKIMLLIFLGSIAISIPGAALVGICNGYEKFVFPKVTSIIKYLIRSVLVVAVLLKGTDALGLVILDATLNVLLILTNAYYVFIVLKVPVKFHELKGFYLKEIFGYAIWAFIFGLVYQFQWRTGQIVLGATKDTTTVAVFSVGVTLGLYFLTFGNVINGLILPRAVKSVYANETPEQLTASFIKFSRLSFILVSFILCGFVVLGQNFINLWVGEHYQNAWLVALLIMIAYVIPISQGYAHALLEAKKLMRFKSLSALILTIIGLILGGIGSINYGINGMILGIFLALISLQLVVMYYYHTKLKISIITYFFQVFFPFVGVGVVVCLIASYSTRFLNEDWVSFGIKTIIYVAIFMIGYPLILKPSEKQLILEMLKLKKTIA